MISYSDVTQSNVVGLQFVVRGDGVATQLVVNLTKPPFNINFSGTIPASVLIAAPAPGITATAAIVSGAPGDVMTVTFTPPPPNDPDGVHNIGLNATFVYASL